MIAQCKQPHYCNISWFSAHANFYTKILSWPSQLNIPSEKSSDSFEVQIPEIHIPLYPVKHASVIKIWSTLDQSQVFIVEVPLCLSGIQHSVLLYDWNASNPCKVPKSLICENQTVPTNCNFQISDCNSRFVADFLCNHLGNKVCILAILSSVTPSSILSESSNCTHENCFTIRVTCFFQIFLNPDIFAHLFQKTIWKWHQLPWDRLYNS